MCFLAPGTGRGMWWGSLHLARKKADWVLSWSPHGPAQPGTNSLAKRGSGLTCGLFEGASKIWGK